MPYSRRQPFFSEKLILHLLKGTSKNQLFFVGLPFKSPPKGGNERFLEIP